MSMFLPYEANPLKINILVRVVVLHSIGNEFPLGRVMINPRNDGRSQT